MDWTTERKEQLEILDRLINKCITIPCHPEIKADAMRLKKYAIGEEEIKTSFLQFLHWIRIKEVREQKQPIER